MATIADIATGDTVELVKQTDVQRRMERMNMIRKVKTGRKLVGKAADIQGAKFVASGLADAKFFKNSSGEYEIWASYGFITCEFSLTLAEQRVGLAYGKFSEVNIIEHFTAGAIIYEVWGIL